MFISTETVNFSTHSADVIWNCPRQHYYCKHQKRSRSGCVHIRNHICDGIDHCSGRDETYCDLNVYQLTYHFKNLWNNIEFHSNWGMQQRWMEMWTTMYTERISLRWQIWLSGCFWWSKLQYVNIITPYY
jgi:hypothetical protein